MDWSKTKSIFIIVFLILDIFLMSLFINKVSESNPETLSQVSFEEQLKTDKIDYPKNLSKDPLKEAYISAKTKVFTEKEIEKLKNQEVYFVTDNTIHSTLDEPYSISEKFSPDELNDFMKNQVAGGEKYSFWKYNKDEQTIIYYQTYKDRQLFNNSNGKVILILNKESEIVSYKQTRLENLEELSGEKKSLLTSLQALQVLWTNHKITTGSTIKTPELGYYTFLSREESQVLAPTWHFVVESGDIKEDLFINAVEGQIFEVSKPEKEILE
ncbi:MAG: two-component system regulatory protein YycI [Bacillota bacterium]